MPAILAHSPERRSPSPVKVGIMWTTFGALLTASFFWLVSDATGRRDAMLLSHEGRIQTLERSEARRDAQFEEILRRLTSIETALKRER